MKRLEITVRGDVQGVNFRNETEREARRLGLAGRVWNAPDGSVAIVAEGPEDKLRVLLDWTKRGPDRARVDAHDVAWSDAAGDMGDFRIRR